MREGTGTLLWENFGTQFEENYYSLGSELYGMLKSDERISALMNMRRKKINTNGALEKI